jgi:hypothetical protein
VLKDDDVYAGLLHEVPGHLVPGLHRLHIRHLARHSFLSSLSLGLPSKRYGMVFPFTGAKTKIRETVTFPAPLNGYYGHRLRIDLNYGHFLTYITLYFVLMTPTVLLPSGETILRWNGLCPERNSNTRYSASVFSWSHLTVYGPCVIPWTFIEFCFKFRGAIRKRTRIRGVWDSSDLILGLNWLN